MNITPPALVLGTDCLTGLQATRILWRKKIPVIGVADDVNRAYCRSRSVKKTISTRSLCNDPVPVLQAIAEEYNARPVLIVCTDEFVWWLNDHREQIEMVADFILPASDTLLLLSDKALFYRYVIENNLPLTPTRFIHSPEDLEQASKDLPFPVAIKPPRRSVKWMELSRGLKAVKADSPEKLIEAGTPLLAAGDLIVQGWVSGPAANTRELSVCFDRHGNPLAHIFLRKIRQWPPHVGVSSLAEEVPAEEVVVTGLELLKKLGFAGAGQIEFKRDDRDGQLYIIEMNAGRVALNFALSEACGMEMIYTCYCAAAGLPLPETRAVTRPGGKWICWKWDLLSAFAHWRQRELSFGEWLRSLRGHKWSADLQFDDPGPLHIDLAQKTAHHVLRAIRKLSQGRRSNEP